MDFLSDEERILSAHIRDLEALSLKSGVPRFSRFLNEREAVVAKAALRTNNSELVFYGGYDGAARTVCGIFSGTYAEELPLTDKRSLFPVRAVTFSFRACDRLTHRDFLGAIMNLGLERSVVGDIAVSEGYAVVFCHNAVLSVISELTKIGRVGVDVSEGVKGEIPKARFERLERTVSSLRLDRVVGACTNLSGDRSALLVKSGQVSADFSVCLNVGCIVKEKTVITIRGYGKFRLAEIVSKTGKGKIRLVIEKYA